MSNENKKIKKLNVFKMSVEEIEAAYLEAKKELLELNLRSKKEYIPSFSYRKNALRKNVARCKMVIS